MHLRIAALIVLLGFPSVVTAQAPPGPNAHPIYVELRNVAVGGSVQVNELVLTKDAATFTLTGTVHLLKPVNGRVTGAVFLGQGSMKYVPPIAVERSMLRNLTRGEDFNETFERAVFRFTDDTAEEILANSSSTISASTLPRPRPPRSAETLMPRKPISA